MIKKIWIVGVAIISLIACGSKMSIKADVPGKPVRSLHIAYMKTACFQYIPPLDDFLIPPIEYRGRIDYYKDGSIVSNSIYSWETKSRERDLNEFIANVSEYIPEKTNLTAAEVINNDDYFSIFKDNFIFRWGGVEISPEVGEIYLKNKWENDNKKYPLLDSIVSSGHQVIYIDNPNPDVEAVKKEKANITWPRCVPTGSVVPYKNAEAEIILPEGYAFQ